MVGPLTQRYPVFMGLAAGDIGEQELAEWLREHSRPDRISELAAEYR